MIIERIQRTIEERGLAGADTPVLLMVSGGSDSTALAYIAADLRERGVLGPLAVLHVNHQLRGADANADAEFVRQLAEALELPFFLVEVNVGAIAQEQGENTEAVARSERYAAAQEALESLCRHTSHPVSDGRIFTAHTQDDRVEAFYMRSIVGTGPGGFRSMRYTNGAVARPCLDVSRQGDGPWTWKRGTQSLLFVMLAEHSGAKMPPMLTPTASVPMCVTKSYPRQSSAIRSCSMCFRAP